MVLLATVLCLLFTLSARNGSAIRIAGSFLSPPNLGSLTIAPVYPHPTRHRALAVAWPEIMLPPVSVASISPSSQAAAVQFLRALGAIRKAEAGQAAAALALEALDAEAEGARLLAIDGEPIADGGLQASRTGWQDLDRASSTLLASACAAAEIPARRAVLLLAADLANEASPTGAAAAGYRLVLAQALGLQAELEWRAARQSQALQQGDYNRGKRLDPPEDPAFDGTVALRELHRFLADFPGHSERHAAWLMLARLAESADADPDAKVANWVGLLGEKGAGLWALEAQVRIVAAAIDSQRPGTRATANTALKSAFEALDDDDPRYQHVVEHGLQLLQLQDKPDAVLELALATADHGSVARRRWATQRAIDALVRGASWKPMLQSQFSPAERASVALSAGRELLRNFEAERAVEVCSSGLRADLPAWLAAELTMCSGDAWMQRGAWAEAAHIYSTVAPRSDSEPRASAVDPLAGIRDKALRQAAICLVTSDACFRPGASSLPPDLPRDTLMSAVLATGKRCVNEAVSRSEPWSGRLLLTLSLDRGARVEGPIEFQVLLARGEVRRVGVPRLLQPPASKTKARNGFGLAIGPVEPRFFSEQFAACMDRRLVGLGVPSADCARQFQVELQVE